jgi:hypothetical protein
VSGAEENDVVVLKFVEDVGLGVVVEVVISSMMSLSNEN